MYRGVISPRQLFVWLLHVPADSALARALEPDLTWGLPEQLLAAIYDALQQGNWQRAGDTRAPRPKPLPRPGVTTTTNTRRHGRTHLSREEALAILRPVTSEGGDDGD